LKKQPTLAERIRSLRESAGLSQEGLATQCGLTKQAVQLIEAGRRSNPQVNTVSALAKALGVTVEELIG
jgi:transcriptional regulator with XRE-family HTH domain